MRRKKRRRRKRKMMMMRRRRRMKEMSRGIRERRWTGGGGGQGRGGRWQSRGWSRGQGRGKEDGSVGGRGVHDVKSQSKFITQVTGNLISSVIYSIPQNAFVRYKKETSQLYLSCMVLFSNSTNVMSTKCMNYIYYAKLFITFNN